MEIIDNTICPLCREQLIVSETCDRCDGGGACAVNECGVCGGMGSICWCVFCQARLLNVRKPEEHS